MRFQDIDDTKRNSDMELLFRVTDIYEVVQSFKQVNHNSQLLLKCSWLLACCKQKKTVLSLK